MKRTLALAAALALGGCVTTSSPAHKGVEVWNKDKDGIVLLATGKLTAEIRDRMRFMAEDHCAKANPGGHVFIGGDRVVDGRKGVSYLCTRPTMGGGYRTPSKKNPWW